MWHLSSATGVCFVSALSSPHVHSLCTFLFSLCHILSLSLALSLFLSLSLSLALALSRSLSLSLSLSQRIVFEVWPDVAPLAVKNFIALATGSKGSGASGKPLHYAGNAFHRVVQVRFLSSDSIASICLALSLYNTHSLSLSISLSLSLSLSLCLFIAPCRDLLHRRAILHTATAAVATRYMERSSKTIPLV